MSDEYLYARVKPYNPKRGHLVQRIFVRALGRVIEGGDGRQRPIEWIQVRPDQASLLRTYRQDDQDPDAKQVFDIVTLEQRQAIDRAEEAARIAGVSAAPAPKRKAPQGRVTDVRQGEGVLDAGKTEQELGRRKLVLAGNEQYDAAEEGAAPDAKPVLIDGADAFIQDPAVVGRMQALAGLDKAPAPAPELPPEPAPAPNEPESAEEHRPRRAARGRRRAQAQPISHDVPTPRSALPPLDEGADINKAIDNQPAEDPDGD